MIFAYLINIYIYITSWFGKKQYDNSMEMMRMNSNNDDDNYLLYEETSNLIEKDNYYIPSLKEYKENKRFNKIQRSVSEPDYKYRYNCSNCKLYIHNQIFMYEDNSYCSEKCRQVKMNKKRFASSSF
tara:strand:+ start:229 stop:609 length:381 start_codon:yes stop_codon:yes gene_type:complete